MPSRYFLIILIVLGGCGSVSQGDKASVYGPIELEDSMDKALTQDFFEVGGWPTERWWEMFQDPQLNRLMELAIEGSPTLQRAYARVTSAEEEARVVRAKLLPWLSADYLEQWQHLSKNGFDRSFFPLPPGFAAPSKGNQIDLALNFSWEIDFFGKNRNLFQAALGQARAQRAEAAQAKLILTTMVAQTYIDLQIKLLQKEVIKEKVEEREAFFALTAERQISGLDADPAVLKSEQNIYQIEQALLNLEKEIAIDAHKLKALVGYGPDVKLVAAFPKAGFNRPFPLPTNLSSDLLARRPDLGVQIWRVEAAAKQIGAAKADFYPRVNLLAFAGLESLAFKDLFKISSRMGGLVPAIHLPIFEGGRLRANLKEKVAEFNEAVYHYNEILLHAAQDVADQLVTLTATFKELHQQINALEAEEEKYEIQFARYEYGLSNLLSIYHEQEILLNQRFLLYGYQRDYLLSCLKLIKALGGGYQN